MFPLVGPILAQLVTLGVADRTELRYIDSDDKYFEAATSPRAALNFGWKHTTLSLGYGPSITLTPLDSMAPDVLVFHTAGISMSYHWRHTTVTASQYIGYGKVNFRIQGLADQRAVATPAGTGDTTTTPMPGTGTAVGAMPGMAPGTTGTGVQSPNQVRADDLIVRYATSTTNLSVTQAVTPLLTLTGGVGYSVAGSVGPNASPDYPIVQGPHAQALADYRLTFRDDVTTTASIQYAASATGNDSWILLANEAWGHVLDKQTSSRVGAGVSMARNSLVDGTIYYTIDPTFLASLSHKSLLERGTLTLGIGTSAAPVLDPIRATVDPQLGVNASIGWSRDRFSTTLSGNGALSLTEPNAPSALDSGTGSFVVAYRLGAGFSADTGVRAFWQSYAGQTTVPLSFAGFLGVTYLGNVPLNGGL